MKAPTKVEEVEDPNAARAAFYKTPVASKVIFVDTTPAYWVITRTSDTTLTAYNTNSSETFEGTFEDFNAAMRG